MKTTSAVSVMAMAGGINAAINTAAFTTTLQPAAVEKLSCETKFKRYDFESKPPSVVSTMTIVGTTTAAKPSGQAVALVAIPYVSTWSRTRTVTTTVTPSDFNGTPTATSIDLKTSTVFCSGSSTPTKSTLPASTAEAGTSTSDQATPATTAAPSSEPMPAQKREAVPAAKPHSSKKDHAPKWFTKSLQLTRVGAPVSEICSYTKTQYVGAFTITVTESSATSIKTEWSTKTATKDLGVSTVTSTTTKCYGS